MRHLLFLAATLCFLLSSSFLFGQRRCPPEAVYHTTSIGNGKEAMPFALMFFFKGDTLRIANNERQAKASDNVPFLITQKTCNWNADGTEGRAVYRLLLTEEGTTKRPTLTIRVGKGKGTITMLYPNAEPRVFDLLINND